MSAGLEYNSNMNTLSRNSSFYLLLFFLVLADCFALYLSFEVALFIEGVDLHSTFFWWIFLFIFGTFFIQKIYLMRYDFWGDAKKILNALFFSFFAIFTIVSFAKISELYQPSLITTFFLVALFMVLFFKRVVKKILFAFPFFQLKVKIVANEENYATIDNEIKKNWYFGYRSDDACYDMVLIASRGFDQAHLQELIADFSHKTKDIFLIPYLDNIDFSHSTIVDFSNIRFSAIHIENRLLNPKNISLKYIIEKIVVVFLSPFALFLHLFISYLIKADSSGAVFFKQHRVGKNAQLFECYKYRTMYENSQEILQEYLAKNPQELAHYALYHKYENDPRITKVGLFLRKSSLDELPQFYNILKGDMNFIGPRPYLPQELDAISKEGREMIFKVHPGLTGLWQVSGRNELTFQKRVALDIWYIQNWSLWVDFVIFLKTLKAVALKVGAK